MPELRPEPMSRVVFNAQTLVEEFPPQLRDRNKKAVYRIACPPGGRHGGQLVFTRWAEMPLPEQFPTAEHRTIFESREDVFGYEPTPSGVNSVEWYLNFAHHDLFCAYYGPAFAQDEMQVAEHPVLASLREALLNSKTVKPLTVENGWPTPVLIRGVERRCSIATNRDEAACRPLGLYGNNFSRAKPDVIERATTLIVPPTITNLIAMEAPAYGSGPYTLDDINYILRTAYSGFRAVRIETDHAAAEANATSPPGVVIHTGFWGCGAYGGNRVLMAILQCLAARLAEVDRLVFHTFDRVGTEAYKAGLKTVEQELLRGEVAASVKTVELQVKTLGLQWGTSDGN